MLHDNLSVLENNHLAFAGVDTVSLAAKYGTPLYVIDEDKIRNNCRLYTESINKYFGENSSVLYASKALCFKNIYRILKEEKLCADVVSAGELYTALKSGFPAERIFFHGNNKTDAEIEYGIESRIGYFVTDNPDELRTVNSFALRSGIRQKVLLRLTPGIDPHTFEAVNTGKVDSKFGMPIETGQALPFVSEALSLPGITVEGFHCHIGSQIFTAAPFIDAAAIMLDFISAVKSKLGYDAKILNLGGGFGVRYVESDPEINIPDCIAELAAFIRSKCAELGMRLPVIMLEPGRSIVADAGLTLYTIGNVKTINGYKSYASVDGGMTDNPRFALYGSVYTSYIASRAGDPADFKCTLAGRNCESGDIIQENIYLSDPVRGDIAAVLVTGAYNYSMASNYNRVGRPPVVMLRNGSDYLAVKRESFEDMTANDL